MCSRNTGLGPHEGSKQWQIFEVRNNRWEAHQTGFHKDSFKSSRISLDKSFLKAPWAFAAWRSVTPQDPGSPSHCLNENCAAMATASLALRRTVTSELCLYLNELTSAFENHQKRKDQRKHWGLSEPRFKSILWVCQDGRFKRVMKKTVTRWCPRLFKENLNDKFIQRNLYMAVLQLPQFILRSRAGWYRPTEYYITLHYITQK